MVSAVVGIACIVPVFGPLLGTIAGALIILLADPIQVIWFGLFMLVLHLVNKKMIRPRVVRTGVEASSVFMFTAIIVMTGLLGFWGLIIGVPVFAILYTILYSAVNRRLAKKGLATDAYDYCSTEAGREIYREEEARRRRAAVPGTGRTDAGRESVFTEELPCITEEEIAAYKEKRDASDESEPLSAAQPQKEEAGEEPSSLKK